MKTRRVSGSVLGILLVASTLFLANKSVAYPFCDSTYLDDVPCELRGERDGFRDDNTAMFVLEKAWYADDNGDVVKNGQRGIIASIRKAIKAIVGLIKRAACKGKGKGPHWCVTPAPTDPEWAAYSVTTGDAGTFVGESGLVGPDIYYSYASACKLCETTGAGNVGVQSDCYAALDTGLEEGTTGLVTRGTLPCGNGAGCHSCTTATEPSAGATAYCGCFADGTSGGCFEPQQGGANCYSE